MILIHKYTKQAVHKATAHHLPTNAQTARTQATLQFYGFFTYCPRVGNIWGQPLWFCSLPPLLAVQQEKQRNWQVRGTAQRYSATTAVLPTLLFSCSHNSIAPGAVKQNSTPGKTRLTLFSRVRLHCLMKKNFTLPFPLSVPSSTQTPMTELMTAPATPQTLLQLKQKAASPIQP